MFQQRLRAYFFPSPASLALIWAAFFVLVILLALGGLVGIGTQKLADSLIVVFLFGDLAACVLLLIAAWREKRFGPRALILALVMALWLALALSLLAYAALMDVPYPEGALILMGVCCAPVFLLLGVLALVFGFKALPELRSLLRAARYHRLTELIQARGEASLAELAAELELPEEQATALVEDAINGGDLMAWWGGDRLYSVAALAEKQRLLCHILHARGRVRLKEMAGELRVPVELAKEWIYHLAQRGLLHGFADWERQMVYSFEAGFLAENNRCPRCNGKLALVGKGVVQCKHCAVEIFLGAAGGVL